MVLYHYAPSRNAATLKRLLTGPEGPYRGKAVCDGLKLHDLLEEDPAFQGLVLCGCLTHCRRYYDKAGKISEMPSGQSLSRVAIKEYLGKVFHIERQIEERREARERAGGVWELAETRQIRQERSAPIMQAFKSWVDDLAPGVPPTSALGKALGYTIGQWSKLTRFLAHPEVPAHNNRVETTSGPSPSVAGHGCSWTLRSVHARAPISSRSPRAAGRTASHRWLTSNISTNIFRSPLPPLNSKPCCPGT
jgi:hypothetical protein